MKYGHYQMVVTDTVINAGEEDEARVLDRTWKDIYDAFKSGIPVVVMFTNGDTVETYPVSVVGKGESLYGISAGEITYTTDNENGIPTSESIG